MKKLLVIILVILITLIGLTSCKFTTICPAYSKSEAKEKARMIAKYQKRMSKKIFKPGMIY